VWNEKFQKNNDHLVKRQQVLMEAWKKARAEKGKDEGWLEFWLEKRRAALLAEGMEPVW
jgi:hypothetical protein